MDDEWSIVNRRKIPLTEEVKTKTIPSLTSVQDIIQNKRNTYVERNKSNQYSMLVDFTDDEEYVKLLNLELLALFSKSDIYNRTDDWKDTCRFYLSDKYQEDDAILKNLHLNASGTDSKSLEQMKIFTDFTELLIRLVPFINVQMLNAIFSSPWIGAVIELFSECIKQQPSAIAYQVKSMESHMKKWRSQHPDAYPQERDLKYSKITSSLFEEPAKTGDHHTDVDSTPAPTTVDATLPKINLSDQIIEAIFWYMCSRISTSKEYDFSADTFIIEGNGILDELKKTPHDTNDIAKMVFKFMSKIITEMIKNNIEELELESKNDAELKSKSPSLIRKTGKAAMDYIRRGLGRLGVLREMMYTIPIIDEAKKTICQRLPNHCGLFRDIFDGVSLGTSVSISSTILKHICDKKNEALEDGCDIDKFFKLHTELFGDLQIGTSNPDVIKLRRRLHDMSIKPNSPDTVIDRIVGFVKTAPFKAIIFACLSYNASSGDSDSLINVLNSDFTMQLESNSDISLNVRVMSVIVHNTDIPFIVPFRNALAVYKNPKIFMFCNRVTVNNIESELTRIGLFDDMKRQIEGMTVIPPPLSGGGRRGCDISRKKTIQKIKRYTKKWKGTGGYVGEAFTIFTYIIKTYMLTFRIDIVVVLVSSIAVYLRRNTISDILAWIRGYICPILILVSCFFMLIKGRMDTNSDRVNEFNKEINNHSEMAAVAVFTNQLIDLVAKLAPPMRSNFLDMVSEQISRAMHKPGAQQISTPVSDKHSNGTPLEKFLLGNAKKVLKDSLEAAKQSVLKDAKTVAEHKTGTLITINPIRQFDALQHNRFGQQFLKRTPTQINELNGANEYIPLFAKENLDHTDLNTEHKFNDEGGKHLHALVVFANFEDIHHARIDNTQDFTNELSKIIDPYWTPLSRQVHNFVTTHKFSSDTTSVRMPFKDKPAMVEAAQAFAVKFNKLMTDSKGNDIKGVSNSLLKLVTTKANELFPAKTAVELVKLFTDKASLVDYYNNAPDVNIAHRDLVVITQTVSRYLHDGGFSKEYMTLVAPYLLDSQFANEYACIAKIDDGSIFNIATMAGNVLISSTELSKHIGKIMDNYVNRHVTEASAGAIVSGIDMIIAMFPDPEIIAVGKAAGQMADAYSKLNVAITGLQDLDAIKKISAELKIIYDAAQDYVALQTNTAIIKTQCNALKLSSALEYALQPVMDSSALRLKLKEVNFDENYDRILKKLNDAVSEAKKNDPSKPIADLTPVCEWLTGISTLVGVVVGIKRLRKTIFWTWGLPWWKNIQVKLSYASQAATNSESKQNIPFSIDLMGGGVLTPRYLNLGYKNNKNITKTRTKQLKKIRRNYYAKKTYKLRYNGINRRVTTASSSVRNVIPKNKRIIETRNRIKN